MHEFIESHLRYLVADRLGVGDQELVPDVDLREDLAVDSLDLLELVLAVEAEFGIALPERVLDRVRRYGDLVDAIFREIPVPVLKGPVTGLPMPVDGSCGALRTADGSAWSRDMTGSRERFGDALPGRRGELWR